MKKILTLLLIILAGVAGYCIDGCGNRVPAPAIGLAFSPIIEFLLSVIKIIGDVIVALIVVVGVVLITYFGIIIWGMCKLAKDYNFKILYDTEEEQK